MLTTSKEFLQHVFRDFTRDECPSMAAAFGVRDAVRAALAPADRHLHSGPRSGSAGCERPNRVEAQRRDGPAGRAAQIQTMVTNVAQNHAGGLIATAAGFVGLILSATSVLLQLQHCLNKAWKVRVVGSGLKHFAMQRVRSIFLLIGAGILAMVSVAASSAISALAHLLPFPGAVHAALIATSLIMFAILFAAILKVMPNVHLRWSDVGRAVSLLPLYLWSENF